MPEFYFADPDFFWLFLIFPLLVIYYIVYEQKNTLKLRFSSIKYLPLASPFNTRHLLFIIRLLALSFLIIALARPQTRSNWEGVSTEGIDIAIAFDISNSMLAEDIRPNRLQAAKNLALEFITTRSNDRIGLTVFGNRTKTICPLTIDHDMLKKLFLKVNNENMYDGTATAEGLLSAVNLLKNSKAQSKVILFISDGFNTDGAINPMDAIDIAQLYGIKIMTIGVGRNGRALYPSMQADGTIVKKEIEVKMDETSLQLMTQLSRGVYFNFKDINVLTELYKELEELPKDAIRIMDFSKKTEVFLPFALIAALLLLIELILKNTLFKSIT